MNTDLVAVALIELDASTRQCVWSYPSIDNGTEQQLITRASQVDERSNVFFFSKHKQVWQYYLAVPGPTDGPAKVVTLCLLSAQFSPEKCEALLRVLATQYVGSGCNPQAVLASYLEVFTQKQVGKATPLWRVADFDEKTPLLGGSLSDVVSAFGIHSVLIWTAVLLKKRIVIVGETVEQVVPVVRVLPQMVWARQNWSILRPLVTPSDAELADLASAGVFAAGFLESSGMKSRGNENLFDLLVDVGARDVVVSEHAKEDFRMGELHKEVATFMVEASEANSTDADFIKGLLARTNKIVSATKQLCESDPTLSQATLDGAKVPKATQRFMVNVALAEGFLSNKAEASV